MSRLADCMSGAVAWMTNVKNGDEVPPVIVQAPGWTRSAKRFSAAEHYRSFSSRRLARSARSVRGVMKGHVVPRQRPERVARCDPGVPVVALAFVRRPTDCQSRTVRWPELPLQWRMHLSARLSARV